MDLPNLWDFCPLELSGSRFSPHLLFFNNRLMCIENSDYNISCLLVKEVGIQRHHCCYCTVKWWGQRSSFMGVCPGLYAWVSLPYRSCHTYVSNLMATRFHKPSFLISETIHCVWVTIPLGLCTGCFLHLNSFFSPWNLEILNSFRESSTVTASEIPLILYLYTPRAYQSLPHNY